MQITQTELYIQLRELGFEKVKKFRHDEVHFVCPLQDWHENATGFIHLTKGFFHCYSCKASMPNHKFFKQFGISTDITADKTETRIKGVKYVSVTKKAEPIKSQKFEYGCRLFEEGTNIRLVPKVMKYFERRLGHGFTIPGGLHIRYHEQRNSVMFKGQGRVILERFSGKQRTPVNYGTDLMYWNVKPKDNLFLVEGIFDGLKLAQLGIYPAILLGSQLTDDRMNTLETISRYTIVSMLDPDLPGMLATEHSFKKMIRRRRNPIVFNYWVGDKDNLTDPGDMSYNELQVKINENNLRSLKYYCYPQ